MVHLLVSTVLVVHTKTQELLFNCNLWDSMFICVWSANKVFCMAFDVQLSQRVWVIILILPVMVMAWIKNLEDLSPFSFIANLCICFSLGVIFYEEIHSFV